MTASASTPTDLPCAMPRGGRRHGLRAEGRAQQIAVRVTDDDKVALDEITAEWGVAQAEVIRTLIRREHARLVKRRA